MVKAHISNFALHCPSSAIVFFTDNVIISLISYLYILCFWNWIPGDFGNVRGLRFAHRCFMWTSWTRKLHSLKFYTVKVFCVTPWRCIGVMEASIPSSSTLTLERSECSASRPYRFTTDKSASTSHLTGGQLDSKPLWIPLKEQNFSCSCRKCNHNSWLSDTWLQVRSSSSYQLQ
jgi:hypothetical protein